MKSQTFFKKNRQSVGITCLLFSLILGKNVEALDENCVNEQGLVVADSDCWIKTATAILPKEVTDKDLTFVSQPPSFYFTGNLFEGSTTIQTIPEDCPLDKMNYMSQSHFDTCKQELTKQYKIHIMPKPNQVKAVVQNILKKASNDISFSKLISQMKIMTGPMLEAGQLLPLIVIYPINGQSEAATLINRLAIELKDFEPLELSDLDTISPTFRKELEAHSTLCPRVNTLFNSKLTGPLICYAQGEGASKMDFVFFVYTNPTMPIGYSTSLINQGIIPLTLKDAAHALGYIQIAVIPTEARHALLEQNVTPSSAENPNKEKLRHLKDNELYLLSTPINHEKINSFYSISFVNLLPIHEKFSPLIKQIANMLFGKSPATSRKLENETKIVLKEKLSTLLEHHKLLLAPTKFDALYNVINNPSFIQPYAAQLMTGEEMREELTRRFNTRVDGPTALASAYYDPTFDYAIHPPDFINKSTPQDYRLSSNQNSMNTPTS